VVHLHHLPTPPGVPAIDYEYCIHNQ